MESLKLKLHGENYFSNESQAVRKKINYGKLMHEVFEGIDTPSDIPAACEKSLFLKVNCLIMKSIDVGRKVE